MSGHTLWTTNGSDRCAACHGATPVMPQINGGKSDSTVLDHVFPGMGCAYATGLAVGGASRDAIAQYLQTLYPSAINTTTPLNTNKALNVSSYVSPGGLAFTHVRTVSNPINEDTGVTTGTLTYGAGSNWAGTSITYDPPNNFTGYVTFTYRGVYVQSGSVILNGHTHTARIRVGSTPFVTSGNHSGTVGTSLSTSPGNYTITATNAPTSYGTTGLTAIGLSRSGSTIFGTPDTAGTHTVTLSATNGVGTGTKDVDFVIARGTPTLTFPSQTSVTYAPSGATFSVPNPATFTPSLADTQLNPTYSVSPAGVCTKAVNTSPTITIVGAGNCTVTASFAGNSNWFAAATPPSRTVVINKANQTITFLAQTTASRSFVASGSTFAISPTATTTAAAQAGIAIAYGSSTPTVCTVSGTTVTMLTAGTCTLTANEDGNGNYNPAAQKTSTVTINPIAPGAPTGVGAVAGDTNATISFTAPANSGGSTITGFTATCTAAGQTTRTGTNPVSPITVSSMVNGITYSCSVKANTTAFPSGGTASSPVNVTPQNTPVPPQITSVNNATFTVTQFGTFSVTATGVPAPTLSISGTLPAGVTFTPGTSPRALSGTPASGTAGTYNLVVNADGTNPDATQNFTLTVAKKSQTIDFTDPADRPFSASPVPLAATATSGLTVTFVSQTPAVCSVTGANATMLDVGDCTVEAQQAGNADWAEASPKPTQTFTISQGAQTITFPAQTVASRPIVPNGTFGVDPLATASSGLAVSYSTSTPSVCTANGTQVTMLATGICTIVASQEGNAQYLEATDATRDVTITISGQMITFPAQPDQDFSPGGSFAVNPPATASSGLPVTYSTDTTSSCQVEGSTVSIVAVGTCTIKADQAGNANYTPAATVMRDVLIKAVVPEAPTIGVATPANSQATLAFDPPDNDGGSPITSYSGTCSPGNLTGSSAASPVVVTGLTNGVSYTCSVAAVNAVGTGASSATVPVTPSAQGPALWVQYCQACHGTTPTGARFNAAGSRSVLNHVIATNPEMATPELQALTDLEKDDLVAHIASYLGAMSEQTAPNEPKTISVAGQVVLNTFSFTQIVVDTPPANGTLSTFNGTDVVYTPNAGYTGPDSFVFHAAGPSVSSTQRTANITVTGSAPLLTVARVGTGGGFVYSELPTSGIQCGSDCTEAYAPGQLVTLFPQADPGSTFIGWSGDCTGTGQCSVTMSAARNVTATFDLTPFDLAVSKAGAGTGSVFSSPGGIACGATCTAGFAPGTPVTLTHAADAGSQFTGWAGACTGTGGCNIAMDASKAVTATFTPVFTLDVAKAGAGSGTVASLPAGISCGSTCSAEFLTGTMVQLTATASAGSAFTGWSGACTGTGTCEVTLDQARSVTATFTPVFTLAVGKSGPGTGTITSLPAGISCGATCSAEFLAPAVVELFVAPGPGAAFTGWSGACTGTGACQVTMDQARSVTATFAQSHVLTVSKNGTGAGTISSAPVGIGCGSTCAFAFPAGTVVTLGKFPAAGSVFVGWSGDCSGAGSCTVTMDQARNVTATFSAAAQSADLSIGSQSAEPLLANVDQDVAFTLNVVNNGPDTATGVVLTDTLPSGTTFVSASGGCSQAGGTVTCNLGSLNAGAGAQVVVTVRPTAAGTITNSATVASALADPLGSNNASSMQVTVQNANPVRLGNISTRMQVLTGNDVMIGGFVIGGLGNKTVVVRARGPSLIPFGITNALANPTLRLVRASDQQTLATNDDWQSAANAADITASGFAPSDSLESAILVSLAPGAYTAIVSGVGNGTGVGIVEVFEVDTPAAPLANISTRGQVLTGNDVMIGGFVVSGSGSQTVVVRARGPSLIPFGITNALANPTLRLVRASDQQTIATNDDWQQAANAADILASGFAPSDNLESAILITLPPGAYTVIVSGVGSGTGVGIVEVFDN